jgi:hypothetical protein
VGLIYCNLLFYRFYAFVDYLITWWLEVRWSLVVALSNHINSAFININSLTELKEIESDEVIKVLAESVVTIEVNAVIKLGKL